MDIIKVDLEGFQTTEFKEKNFDPSFSEPLYDAFEAFANPSIIGDPNEAITVESPTINNLGIKVDSFVEKPIFIPSGSYYYPLDNDLNGTRHILDNFAERIENEVSNINGYPEYFINDCVHSVFGSQTRGAYINYIGDVELPDWKTTDINSLPLNVISDSKGVSIHNNTSTDIFFIKEINIPITGYYCFSGYFRVEGSNSTKICGLHLSPSNITDPNQYSVNNFDHFNIVDLDVENYNNRDYFEVKPEWTFISVVSYVNAGNYNAIIFWPQTVNNNTNKNTGDELKVCGLRIDEGTSPNTVSTIIDEVDASDKQSIMIFDLNKIIDLFTNNWSLYYYRYLRYNKDYLDYYDSIGNIRFGFNNNNLVVNNTYTEFDSSIDICNNWGINILTYENQNLTFRTIGKYYDISSTPYHIEEPEELAATIASDEISYNLSLGNLDSLIGNLNLDILDYLYTVPVSDINNLYIENWRDYIWPGIGWMPAMRIIYSSLYRDLVFIPRVITEDEINRIRKNLIGISDKVGINNSNKGSLTLRNPRLIESRYGM